MREELLEDGQSLPLVMRPDSAAEQPVEALEAWIRSNGAELRDRMREHGGVLFRGFGIDGAADFERLARAFQSDLQDYIEGQSQRERIAGKVYNSTYYPPDQRITIHNELSYTASAPRYLFFYCEHPSDVGGETPIVDCRRVLDRLSPATLDTFREKGVRYVKNMHAGKGFGKSWQEHFETESTDVVESYLTDNEVDFEWRDGGTLHTSQKRPSTIKHPETGEEVWFNQASLWHVSDQGRRGEVLLRMKGEDGLATNAYFGDGEPMDNDMLDEVRRVTWDEASIFPWAAGDLLLLDNYLVAHGRNSYEGDRHLLVAMG